MKTTSCRNAGKGHVQSMYSRPLWFGFSPDLAHSVRFIAAGFPLKETLHITIYRAAAGYYINGHNGLNWFASLATRTSDLCMYESDVLCSSPGCITQLRDAYSLEKINHLDLDERLLVDGVR